MDSSTPTIASAGNRLLRICEKSIGALSWIARTAARAAGSACDRSRLFPFRNSIAKHALDGNTGGVVIRNPAVQPFVVVRLVDTGCDLDVLRLAFMLHGKVLDGARPIFHGRRRLVRAVVGIEADELAVVGQPHNVFESEKG